MRTKSILALSLTAAAIFVSGCTMKQGQMNRPDTTYVQHELDAQACGGERSADPLGVRLTSVSLSDFRTCMEGKGYTYQE